MRWGLAALVLLLAFSADGQVFGRWNKNAEQKKGPSGPVLLALTDPGNECSGAAIPGLTFTRAGTQPCAGADMTTAAILGANQPAIEPDGLNLSSTNIIATVANPFPVGQERVYGLTLTGDKTWGQMGGAVLLQAGADNAANSATLLLASEAIFYRERDAANVQVQWASPKLGPGPHHIRIRVPVSGDAELLVDGAPVIFTRSGSAATRMASMPPTIRIGSYLSGLSRFLGRMRNLCLATSIERCPPEIPTEQAQVPIVALGDSITAGSHLASSSAVPYPRRLQYLRGYSGNAVVNAGVGARIASQALTDWTNNVRGRGFSTLVLMVGVNDIIFNSPASVPWPNIKQIIDEAKADGLSVVVSTVLPLSASAPRQAELDALNALIRDYAAEQSLILVDGYVLMGDPSEPTRLLPAYNSGDNLHPNEAGNIAFAQAVYDALNPPAPLAAKTSDESSNGALAGFLLLAAAGATAAGVRYARRGA